MDLDSENSLNLKLKEFKSNSLDLVLDFIDNIVQEITIEGDFSNVDLFLFLDDIMTNLKSIIQNQIIEIRSKLKNYPDGMFCFEKVNRSFDETWDKQLEKIANTIIKQDINDEIFDFMLNQIEKGIKTTINRIVQSLKQCIEI